MSTHMDIVSNLLDSLKNGLTDKCAKDTDIEGAGKSKPPAKPEA